MEDAIRIKVEIEIPGGDGCYHRGGYGCPYMDLRTVNRDGWCNLFGFEYFWGAYDGDDMIEYQIVGGKKCSRCLAEINKARGGGEKINSDMKTGLASIALPEADSGTGGRK